jgi:hypothetical protein
MESAGYRTPSFRPKLADKHLTSTWQARRHCAYPLGAGGCSIAKRVGNPLTKLATPSRGAERRKLSAYAARSARDPAVSR